MAIAKTNDGNGSATSTITYSASAGDIVVIGIGAHSHTNFCKVKSITDTGGLTWRRRRASKQLHTYTSNSSDRSNIELWWAYAASAQTSKSITITFNTTSNLDYSQAFWASFSGVGNTSKPWASAAAGFEQKFTNSGSTQMMTPSVTSSATGDMLVGFFASLTKSPGSVPTTGVGVTAIGAGVTSTGTAQGVGGAFNTAPGVSTYQWNWNNAQNGYASIGDALGITGGGAGDDSDLTPAPTIVASGSQLYAPGNTTPAVFSYNMNIAADALIVIEAVTESDGGYMPISSMSDGTLTYQRRSMTQLRALNVGSGQGEYLCFEVWWAHSPIAVTSGTRNLTVNHDTSASSGHRNLLFIGTQFQDTNDPLAPWDATAFGRFTYANASTKQTNPSVNYTTTSNNALVLGFAFEMESSGSGVLATAGSGYTSINNLNRGLTPNRVWLNWERKAQAAAGASSVAFSDATGKLTWIVIADALSGQSTGSGANVDSTATGTTLTVTDSLIAGGAFYSTDAIDLIAVVGQDLGTGVTFAKVYDTSTYTPVTFSGTLPSGLLGCATFSPNKTMLAINNASNVFIYDIVDNVPTYNRTLSGAVAANAAHLSWSPDGSRLMCVSAATLKIYNTSTWTTVTNPTGAENSDLVSGDWSPAGDYLAFGYNANAGDEVRLYDAGTFAAATNPASQPGANVTTVRFSPDGNWLAVNFTTTNVFRVYDKSNSWAALSNPSTVPTGTPGGRRASIGWGPSSDRVVIHTNATPFVWSYTRSGTTLTKETSPSVTPSSNSAVGAYDPTGAKYLASSGADPRLLKYTVSGWSKDTDIAYQPPSATLVLGIDSGHVTTVGGTADGSTVTVTSSLIAGSAFEESIASGATLPVVVSLIDGDVVGGAIVDGATLTVTDSLIEGTATGGALAAGSTLPVVVSLQTQTPAAYVPQILTVTTSLVGQSPQATGGALVDGATLPVNVVLTSLTDPPAGEFDFAEGATLNVNVVFIPGTATSPDALAPGTTFPVVVSLIPSVPAAEGDGTVSGGDATIVVGVSLVPGMALAEDFSNNSIRPGLPGIGVRTEQGIDAEANGATITVGTAIVAGKAFGQELVVVPATSPARVEFPARDHPIEKVEDLRQALVPPVHAPAPAREVHHHHHTERVVERAGDAAAHTVERVVEHVINCTVQGSIIDVDTYDGDDELLLMMALEDA